MKAPVKYARLNEDKALQVICNEVGIDPEVFKEKVLLPGRSEYKVKMTRMLYTYFLVMAFGYQKSEVSELLKTTTKNPSSDVAAAIRILNAPGAVHRWRDTIYIIKKYNPNVDLKIQKYA